MAHTVQDVMEALLSGVVVVDSQGCVDEINSVASRVTEQSRETALGRPIEDLVTADHAIAQLTRKVLSNGIPISLPEQRIERRSGEDAVVDIAVSPVFSEGRGPDGAVLVLRDRFANRRLEQLEAERERFIAFGRIAAGLAHEVKNPLGGIRGAGELLARRSETDKNRETADLIVRESTRIAKLVDDFMVFARVDELHLAPANIHRVLDAIIDLLSHDPLAQGIEIVRSFDPSLPEVLIDADRIHQVVLNLAQNALQAMEGGTGRLEFRTRMTLEHRIALETGRPLPTLAIWVIDDGRGMDPDELREAHTPFFTTRSGGTGLGLAVADYWAAQHLGSLDLESEKGVGTRARLTLPLRRPANNASPTEGDAS